ncbi:MAG: phosphotransferase [Piscirickettsiaceae bacterium]|nr:MAG: phosphotransferase [Piscirickettsiaceae bacterium]
MHVDERQQELEIWLEAIFCSNNFSYEPASSDASFRRYFRVLHNEESFVVMDAPPDKEDCVPFVNVAQLLRDHGVQAPKIHHKTLQQGFMLLGDLGSQSYLDALTELTVETLYKDATNVLHHLHDIPTATLNLSSYTEDLLYQEMDLFSEWFLQGLLKRQLNESDQLVLADVQSKLADSALQQPQVFVHRDYHSRNLMVTKVDNPGVIDFQDAVVGPITYDLVSLYRDCYIVWPDAKIYTWLDAFLSARADSGIKDSFKTQQFYQWFDWMGVQRHMKAIGIFSRLFLRDDKAGYLGDIPRTLNYVINVCDRYPELMPLKELIVKHSVKERVDELLASLIQ